MTVNDSILVDIMAEQHAMHDDAADQRLLDDAKALAQGGSSIADYTEKAITIYIKARGHKNLKHYPEFYFKEMFRSGLSPEIKALIPAITNSTDFIDYTEMALTIGVPLERAAAATLPPPTKKETPGESAITIIKLFQADPSDNFKTASKVLDMGLVNLSKVKLGKKNVGVLREMVKEIGNKYSDKAEEQFNQVPILERTDTIEIGILVRQLVLYKKELADNAKYNAKKELADKAEMAPAA